MLNHVVNKTICKYFLMKTMTRISATLIENAQGSTFFLCGTVMSIAQS